MKCLLCTFLSVGLFALVGAAQEDGYSSLFNGKDLTGWEYGPVPVTKKPTIEKLDGKTETKDEVFEVVNGVIVATGKRVMALYTAKEFNKDFIRLGYPLVRRLQKHFARDSAAAMKKAVQIR